MYLIEYHTKVKDDVREISAAWLGEIRRVIEAKLLSNPSHFGKPLHRPLNGYRKLRVGMYRLVFQVSGRRVRVLTIGERSKVYIKATKRLPWN
jgi:mRNA interferase RelE/StbE